MVQGSLSGSVQTHCTHARLDTESTAAALPAVGAAGCPALGPVAPAFAAGQAEVPTSRGLTCEHGATS